MTKYRFSFLLLMCCSLGFSQVEEEVNPPNYIKTINFKGHTNESELPIIKLNERVQLSFDAINGNEDDFYYVIDHYNFDWTPSQLMKSEYLQGFDNIRITDYENSFNTYQIYSHYRLQIPNQQTRIKKSGNYILKILDDNGDIIFSRKFMIYENLANVGVSIKRSRNVKYIKEKQSVDFKISSPTILFNNPKQTVKVAVIQNNNLNTAITNLKPQYTLGRELIYKYDDESSFWGGNEYLYFENKNVRAANIGVQYVDLKDIYEHYLFTDIIRADRPYTYAPDINGNYLITAVDTDNLDIEADYTVIHFSLQHPEIFNKNIHVYGSFNNYAITEDTKMSFNPSSGYYETSLILKQGFYNYKYVITNENGDLDEGAISGNFDVTENNYKVLVYYRNLGARYDRLIGVGEGSSTTITN
ncbi:type IX secretion system plug protein domain-containing protein [Pontimicrobium sp. SW4]|uniref:Type IX secretion system plug protein domain-containing protein n=1 Tax=Pontimicrobium sp. SW4 TaxID=3153519 RepID=A0AAU7BTV0_9FLAO